MSNRKNVCLFGLVFQFVILGGCSVVDSYRVFGPGAEEPRGQAAGSYFLPKNLVHVEASGSTLTVSVVAVQDEAAELQSGFNLSAFSDDDITVTYDKGLLQQVTSIPNDQTGAIILQLAKTVSALRSARVGDAQTTTTFEFDPFNYHQAKQTNAILFQRFGGCVEVEISANVWSPGCGQQSLGRIATAREQGAQNSGGSVAPGIYYRRPIAHRVHVIEKGKSKEITSKLFANDAPIFRIDVDRTLFVQRKTTIQFVDGVPTSIQVVKPSEALAIASLPLQVVQAAISAPTDAITQRSGLAQAQKNSIDAQTTQTNISNAQAISANTPVTRGLTGPVSGANCANIGVSDPVLCAQLMQATP